MTKTLDPLANATEKQLIEMRRRAGLLEAVQIYASKGYSDHAACRAAGLNHTTFIRWRDAFQRGGISGLVPKSKPGRPRKAKQTTSEESR